MQKELFRAMSIHNNQWIINSWYKWQGDNLFMEDEDGVLHLCDANTRSVSYPNMIDKNGKKIFASLSEDGVGGDICEYEHWNPQVAIYDDSRPMFMGTHLYLYEYECKLSKVIGIHKGE